MLPPVLLLLLQVAPPSTAYTAAPGPGPVPAGVPPPDDGAVLRPAVSGAPLFSFEVSNPGWLGRLSREPCPLNSLGLLARAPVGVIIIIIICLPPSYPSIRLSAKFGILLIILKLYLLEFFNGYALRVR